MKDAIHLDVLEDEGIETPAALWGAGVPLTRIIPAVREISPSNLVVCLSALSLAPEDEGVLAEVFRGERPPIGDDFEQGKFEAWKDKRIEELHSSGFELPDLNKFFNTFTRLNRNYAERIAWTPRAIDARLGVWLDSKRVDILRPVRPLYWSVSWFHKIDLNKSNSRYESMAENFVANDWRATRERILAELILVREAGIKVVCVRLPVSPNLLTFEERAVKSEEFVELCDRAGIPYIDYSQGLYSTYDGSHLTFESAERFNLQLAKDLNSLFDD